MQHEAANQPTPAWLRWVTRGSLVLGVIALVAIIAAGTVATALLFAMPRAVEITLLAVAALVAAVAVGTVLLVRRGMMSVLARIARRLRVISRPRFARWRDQLADIDRRLRGVALAFARRVNQLVFAALGFSVLAADRLAQHVDGDALVAPPVPRAVLR